MLWWDQMLVFRFILGNQSDFYQWPIVHGKDLIFVVKRLRVCEGRLVSYYLVIYLNEWQKMCWFLWYFFFVSLYKSYRFFEASIDTVFVIWYFHQLFVFKNVLVVSSRTLLVLRRGWMDGLWVEAQLISIWTRCCTLAGRFIVVKSALSLSREQVLRQGLDLNLGDGGENITFLEKFWIWQLKNICDVIVFQEGYCENLV